MTADELTRKTNSLIGEAGTGEDYTKSDNLAGDQDGYELRARRYYIPKIGWGKVYRITGKNGVSDPTYADQLATLMEKAICNGFIGYDTGSDTEESEETADQDGRNMFLYDLEDAEWVPEAVNVNTETDCSALVYALLRALTGVIWDQQETSGSEFIVSRIISPQVKNFDHYIEYQLTTLQPGFQPGRSDVYDISVFTVADAAARAAGTNLKNSYYDYLVNDHLDVSIEDSNQADYLETFTNLKRGDIIRTVTPNNSGHIVIWL